MGRYINVAMSEELQDRLHRQIDREFPEIKHGAQSNIINKAVIEYLDRADSEYDEEKKLKTNPAAYVLAAERSKVKQGRRKV